MKIPLQKKCSVLSKFSTVYHPPKPQTFELLAKFQVPVQVRFGKGPKLGIIFGFEPFTKMLNLNNIHPGFTHTHNRKHTGVKDNWPETFRD